MIEILAQNANLVGGFSFIQWLKIILIVAGCVGIVFVITKAAGIAIPGWLIQVAGIVLAVFVGLVAIGFLTSLM